MKEKCCRNCTHAQWHLTPSGRIKKDVYGKCTIEFELPVVPSCITLSMHRHFIWPDYGVDCPEFEETQYPPQEIKSNTP
jgi:hypothetical protein